MQSTLRNGLRRIKNLPATAAAERVLDERTLGGGKVWRLAYIEEVLVFAGDAFKALTTPLPDTCRVRSGSLNLDTVGAYSAETNANAVKLGLGTAATPNLIALSGTAVTKNTKTDAQPVEANAIVAASVTPRVSCCQTGGTAATVGTFTGTVRARIVYEYTQSIVDAA